MKIRNHTQSLNIAFILGLSSALAYGAADFLTQKSGRAVGPWRATFYYYVFGFVIVSASLLIRKSDLSRATHAPPSAWGFGLLSGLALLLAVLFFTTGLTRGRIGVVAPVTAGYGAVSTLLSVAEGQRFTLLGLSGLFLTVLGACIVAAPGSQSKREETASGIRWALAAAFAYGIGFWVQGQFVVPAFGPVLPVWMVYFTGLAILGCLHLCDVVDLSAPRILLLVSPIFTSAVLGLAGFLALDIGMNTGHVALVVVLSSLTSAITVIMARIFNGSRLALHQWIAVVLICGGLALIKV